MSIATEEFDIGALSPVEPAHSFAGARSMEFRQGSAAAVALPLPTREGLSRGQDIARGRLHRHALALSDALVAVLALALVVFAAGHGAEPTILLAAPLMVIANRLSRLYDRDELVLHRTTLEEAPAVFRSSALFTLVVWLLYGHAAGLGPRSALMLWGAALALVLAGRAVARAATGRMVAAERCLLIGDAADAANFGAKLKASGANAEVVAMLTVSDEAARVDVAELREKLRLGGIDRLIIGTGASDADGMLDAIRCARLLGLRVSLAPRLLQVVGAGVEFDEVDGLTTLSVGHFGLDRRSRAVKRIFDLLTSTLLIIALAPLMAAIAAAIALDSPGAILFRQVRVGCNNRRFQILKFRSMVNDAEARKEALAHLNQAQGLFKIADDPRITRCGRILRRFCLDELPQLFNVWRGEMSLVGPRPLVVPEDERVVGFDRSRLHVSPGMTGPWQILGSSRIPLHEMVVIDYRYVAHWSLWTDVKVLLRTASLMLTRSGL